MYGGEKARRGTARHRDLRAASQWGTAVVLPPRALAPHTGGALLLGVGASPRASFEADDARWTLVGWPTSTPHEVTPVTSGVRVVLRTKLLAVDSPTAEAQCGASALGDAIDATVPPADRDVLRFLSAARDPTAPFSHSAVILPLEGQTVLPLLLPCVSEFKDAAACNGAQSALGSDGSMFCEWAAGSCGLVVGTCQAPHCSVCACDGITCRTNGCNVGYSLVAGLCTLTAITATSTGTPSSSQTGTPSSSRTGEGASII